MQRRYQSLQLHDAISRREDYAEACRELRWVLRMVYVDDSKPFQAELYEDVMHAFRTLPKMENSLQLDSARALLHMLKVVFANKQQQQLASAAHEFETAATVRQQQRKELGTPHDSLSLSRDILRYVFRSLDARSLATASAVCREWNVAATDGSLWKIQLLYLFCAPNHCYNVAGRPEGICELGQGCWKQHLRQKPHLNSVGVWRKAFSRIAKGNLAYLLTSNRAYCSACSEVLWLTEPRWRAGMGKGKCIASKQSLQYHSLRPMSVCEVARYVICGDWGHFKFPR